MTQTKTLTNSISFDLANLRNSVNQSIDQLGKLALKINQTYQISAFIPNANRNCRSKLLAMGFIPGQKFTITRLAPLGNAVQIEINNFALSLRLKELFSVSFFQV